MGKCKNSFEVAFDFIYYFIYYSHYAICMEDILFEQPSFLNNKNIYNQFLILLSFKYVLGLKINWTTEWHYKKQLRTVLSMLSSFHWKCIFKRLSFRIFCCLHFCISQRHSYLRNLSKCFEAPQWQHSIYKKLMQCKP